MIAPKKLIAGGIVLAIIGVSWFMMLKKDTNTQTIVAEEGSVVTVNTSVEQEENNWSVGGLIAKDTDSDGMIFGITASYRF